MAGRNGQRRQIGEPGTAQPKNDSEWDYREKGEQHRGGGSGRPCRSPARRQPAPLASPSGPHWFSHSEIPAKSRAERDDAARAPTAGEAASGQGTRWLPFAVFDFSTGYARLSIRTHLDIARCASYLPGRKLPIRPPAGSASWGNQMAEATWMPIPNLRLQKGRATNTSNYHKYITICTAPGNQCVNPGTDPNNTTRELYVKHYVKNVRPRL